MQKDLRKKFPPQTEEYIKFLVGRLEKDLSKTFENLINQRMKSMQQELSKFILDASSKYHKQVVNDFLHNLSANQIGGREFNSGFNLSEKQTLSTLMNEIRKALF